MGMSFRRLDDAQQTALRAFIEERVSAFRL
jgi:hypothetical protein